MIFTIPAEDRHTMTDHSRHPLYRAIQQSMVKITQVVKYNEVQDQMFAEDLVTREDLDEYDKLTNAEAVRRMIRKIMSSIDDCEKFLKILQEIEQQQYEELAQLITDKYEENQQNTTDASHTSVQFNEEQITAVCEQVVSKNEADELMQEGKTLIDTLLNQSDGHMKPIIEVMQLKRNAGKSFTEFLLYIIKLFQKAIDDRTITMKNSKRQTITNKLEHITVVLLYVRKDFYSTHTTEEETTYDNSIAIVVASANKVTEVIKSLQKGHWLRWCQSARNLSALVSIFEKITEVVSGIQCINCRSFHRLLGDVATLKASLVDIEIRLIDLHAFGLTVSILIGIGSVVCVIVGGILCVTPVGVPVGVPLGAVGAAGISVAVATAGIIQFSNNLVTKRFERAKAKGTCTGDGFVQNNITKLPELTC